MKTMFVSSLKSISFTVLEDYSFDDNALKNSFQRIWNTTCDEFGKIKSISDNEIEQYKLENNIRVECRNLYTIYFNEEKELPEDNYKFIQLLGNNCIKNGLKIAIMDRVSHAKYVQ